MSDPNTDPDAKLVLAFFGPQADFTRRQLPVWMNEKIDAAVIEIVRRFAPDVFVGERVITAAAELFGALAALPERRAEAAAHEMADAIRRVLKEAGDGESLDKGRPPAPT